MGKHRLRYVCVVCRRRRVPTKHALCYSCEKNDYRLPPLEELPRFPRPAAREGGCVICQRDVPWPRLICAACALPSARTAG
jgi:hypothetical protein